MFRPIYEPRTRAREYCDLAVNIYTGCNHGCIYCYAPHVLHKTREAFETVQPRAGIVEAVKRQIQREQMSGKKIMLCFTCDPYPAAIDTTATRAVIAAIKNSGNHVQILTKAGQRATRDFDLLDSGDSFGVTITGPREWTAENEPQAEPIENRKAALQLAHSRGIKTWVSLEPVYFPEVVYSVIAEGDYIDLFKIGKLNHIPSAIDWGAFGAECVRRCVRYERAYYIKEDLRAEMGKICAECEYSFFPLVGHGTCEHPDGVPEDIDIFDPACELFERADGQEDKPI